MKTIKVWFTDFWPEWNDEDFITPILKKYFNIELDSKNPDVLFHSIFNGMRDTPKYKCKKILYLGENHRPDKFRIDYSISFDPIYAPYVKDYTNFQLPLWQVYLLNKPTLKEELYNRNTLSIFANWNAMVVSNGNNFFRNSLFEVLNTYKKVKSYGRYRTNDNSLISLSSGRYWRDAKLEFFKQHTHKYMMAVENSPYRYYCTEKLMDAFLVGSMPIYWGDTRVSENWNKKAFIDGTIMTTSEILNEVKKLDNDNYLYKQMQQEPVFTDQQKLKLENNLTMFEEWLIQVVNK